MGQPDVARQNRREKRDIHASIDGSVVTKARLSLAITCARAGGMLSAASRRGGTSLPGLVGLRIEPRLVRLLARQLQGGSIVIAGTNGKTTTASLTAAALHEGGMTVVHNRAGSNMARGVATVLAGRSSLLGRIASNEALTGLFEVDEAALPSLLHDIQPSILVLTNLFRDQLDRYGEIATTADRWRAAIRTLKSTTLVLNADDPLIASLAEASSRPSQFFGVDAWDTEDASTSATPVQSADSLYCPFCGSLLIFLGIAYAHLGRYTCPSCGFTRPSPTVSAVVRRIDAAASRIEVRAGAEPVELDLALPGRYNVYNALAAIATAHAAGVAIDDAVKAIATARGVFGRAERMHVKGRTVNLFLIKNPTGADEVFRVVATGDRAQPLLLLLSDNAADGEDVSWIWDANLEILAPWHGNVLCGGTRADDMALRVRYAELAANAETVAGDIAGAVRRGIDAGTEGQALTIVATYTAMLAARSVLARWGKTAQYWEQ